MLKYLDGTREDSLFLSTEIIHVIKWYLDTSFAVHPDFKSHAGGVMTLGGIVIKYISHKQNMNTQSSTEAKLIRADNAYTMMIWIQLFM